MEKPTLDTKLVSVTILLLTQIIIGTICLIYRASDVPCGESIVSPPIMVQIAGQINKPGVYTVATGTRVLQLIELAGGALDDADVNQLNLAAPLFDEQKVVVPKSISVEISNSDIGGKRPWHSRNLRVDGGLLPQSHSE